MRVKQPSYLILTVQSRHFAELCKFVFADSWIEFFKSAFKNWLKLIPASVHCRHMLQQLLTGNELTGTGHDSMNQQEDGIAAIAAARQKYSLKLVDVNSTNKGSPAGGVQSFSAMVVVGDCEVCVPLDILSRQLHTCEDRMDVHAYFCEGVSLMHFPSCVWIARSVAMRTCMPGSQMR